MSATLERRTPFRPDWASVAVIAAGGGLGSLARYGVATAWPVEAGTIAWSTLVINVSGSMLLGLLVVAVTEIWRPHRLVRPGLGTGLLGGWTTFSTFAAENRALLADSHLGTAVAYAALSVLGGVAAAAGAMTLLRRLEPRLRVARTHEGVDPFDPELP
ncbi:CrcB family protein [Jatrophihabitans telluris]|uniref:Fluoride-specific ion channel FluC n=1 Tax=Jatrophihabitans telluris TaxID=2038343 RepID=A0ABY4QZX5_9ACTN|nr:CrcB family protein [Jatrophihabitans telluris]UQX88787.1 CrcB family protein [Jatrophihabitans telluris]